MFPTAYDEPHRFVNSDSGVTTQNNGASEASGRVAGRARPTAVIHSQRVRTALPSDLEGHARSAVRTHEGERGLEGLGGDAS